MDKMIHVFTALFLYLLVELWLAISLFEKEDRIKIAAFLIFTLGLFKEIVLDRSIDPNDILSNIIGIMMGIMMSVLL